MLEGLDDVPWATLHHAYGPASDVPGLIRALAARDADSRERALWELYGNIWHQHTVYEATAHAVPFLVQVATSADVPDETRAGVMQLLADIADGYSYVEVHEPLFQEMDVDLGFEPGQLERELEWVRAAREAVRGALDALTADLEPAAPAERRAAAVYLASMFREDAATLAPRVRAVRDAAEDPALRRGASLALALLGTEPFEDAFEVVSTDDRGRADVLRYSQNGERVEELSSGVLSDILFSEGR